MQGFTTSIAGLTQFSWHISEQYNYKASALNAEISVRNMEISKHIKYIEFEWQKIVLSINDRLANEYMIMKNAI